MKNVSTQEVPTVSHRRHSQSQKGYFKGIEWEKKNNIYFLDKQIWILQACVSHEHFAQYGKCHIPYELWTFTLHKAAECPKYWFK